MRKGLVTLALVLAVLLVGCRGNGGGGSDPTVDIIEADVEDQGDVETVTLTGTSSIEAVVSERVFPEGSVKRPRETDD